MSLHAELTKLLRKENLDTNLDQDPEWFLISNNCGKITLHMLQLYYSGYSLTVLTELLAIS